MKALLPKSLHLLHDEIHTFYQAFYSENIDRDSADPQTVIRQQIRADMNTFMKQHQDMPVILQKAYLHELIADNFIPTLFPHSPFYFEIGMKAAESWGIPASTNVSSCLMQSKMQERETMPEQSFLQLYNNNDQTVSTPLWSGASGFDSDHHCLGYTKLLNGGIKGILAEINMRRKIFCSDEQLITLEAMERSCQAVLKIAARFREQAVKLLEGENDTQATRFLTMIANSANVPENPPKSFYEGLLMLWFLREVTGSIESIGISVIGHLDRQLFHLYKNDIDHGILDEATACDLIARWMLPTDVKCHVWDREWPETSTCLELGGCDENGKIVWNDLTRLFIEVHYQCHLMTPKLNCRYSCQSPNEYLELMIEKIVAGHNHFAFLNDDVLIPANIKYGKSLKDARLYVNGGCQETMCEGVEHTAGAYYYFNLLQALSLCLKHKHIIDCNIPEDAAKIIPEPVLTCRDFYDFYNQIMEKVKMMIKIGAYWRRNVGCNWGKVNPCPWFSATLEECIDNALDYADGGAKYNMSGITLVGLGSFVDSLNAVKVIVFDEKRLTLDELKFCLDVNWDGYNDLRQKVLHLKRYGHGQTELDQLAAKVSDQLAEFIRTLPNERGEFFQPSYFVYYSFKTMGLRVGATPDGRFCGDMMAQGIAPHRVNAPKSITDVLRTIEAVDFCKYPGNAVLDVQLPVANHIRVDNIVAVMRVFAQVGGPTLQMNCASADLLKKAQQNPEKYQDLVVRISGLSACFVRLAEDVQNEIISRAVLTC